MLRSRRTYAVVASFTGALFVLAGCNAIFGLDEKELDGATAPDAGGSDAPFLREHDGGGSDSDEPDAATSEPDADCVPAEGGAPTFYGSCVPHVTSASSVCNEYGTTGGLQVSASGVATQKSACTNLKGTWSDSPCNRSAAVFGCRSGEDPDSACSTLSISWYYPPVTTAMIDSGLCSPALGTVVFP